MRTLMPFFEALTDAKGKMHAATDRECLRSQFDYGSGVLRGYYFAGAVCEVEITAVLDDLRKTYRQRFEALAPDPWPRAVLDDKRFFKPVALWRQAERESTS